MSKKLILFFIVFLTFINNQANEISNSRDSSFLKIENWQILEPIKSENFEKDFLLSTSGETSKLINPLQSVIYLDRRLNWKKIQTQNNIIDLNKIFGSHTSAITYAYSEIFADQTREYILSIGSDDGSKLWLNGELVYNRPESRSLIINEDTVHIKLNKGKNNLLLKINQGIGNWRFVVNIFKKENYSENKFFYISENDLQNQISLPSNRWIYSTDTLNLNPNELATEFVDASMPYNNMDQLQWKGNGLFYFPIIIDSSSINKPLALSMWKVGDAEIFINGDKLNSNQNIPRKNNLVFQFQKKKNLLAIKYKTTDMEEITRLGFNLGFYVKISDAGELSIDNSDRKFTLTAYQIFFVSFSIAIGFFHLIMFIVYPKVKQHIYFSLFIFIYSIVIYLDFNLLIISESGFDLTIIKMYNIAWLLFLVSKVKFFHSLLYEKTPKTFWVVLTVAIINIIQIEWFSPFRLEIVDYTFMITIFEVIRSIVVKATAKTKGAYLIGIAYLLFLSFLILDGLIDLNLISFLDNYPNPYAFGIIVFFLAMSIYLSRDFKLKTEQLQQKEIEQKVLETENLRQSKELEEARELQLSMLPDKIPQSDCFDIAVYLKSANEVGGDYYDFKEHEDDSITIVVGDATGHGMKAGVMVTATKGIIQLLSEHSPIEILKSGTKAIKTMGMKQMYMALLTMKLSADEAEISSAGMPYPILFTQKSNSLSDIILKGMPLGALSEFPYQKEKLFLKQGDILVLLSDGLEELFNDKKEIFGREKINEIIKSVANKSPQEIINSLIIAAEKWANGKAQDDDITIIVIKWK